MNDKKIVLYIVRHGQTLFNKFLRMQGYCDAPLTPEGIEVAEYAAEGMKDIKFSAAYSSTSERAADTALILLQERGLDLTMLKDLKEMFFGDLEGEKSATVKKEHPGLIEKLHAGRKDFKFPNGESIDDLVERQKRAYDEIIEENREIGGNILVVSHGTSILNFLRTVKPDIEIKEQIPNCSANIVTWEDGKFTVEDFGITKYIEKGREIMKESSRA